MEYARYIIFNAVGKFSLEKPEKFGGGKTVYNTYEELEKDFAEGKIPAGDLKYSVANHLNALPWASFIWNLPPFDMAFVRICPA